MHFQKRLTLRVQNNMWHPETREHRRALPKLGPTGQDYCFYKDLQTVPYHGFNMSSAVLYNTLYQVYIFMLTINEDPLVQLHSFSFSFCAMVILHIHIVSVDKCFSDTRDFYLERSVPLRQWGTAAPSVHEEVFLSGLKCASRRYVTCFTEENIIWSKTAYEEFLLSSCCNGTSAHICFCCPLSMCLFVGCYLHSIRGTFNLGTIWSSSLSLPDG